MSGLPRKNIPEIWGGGGVWGGKGNGETADTPNPSLRHPEELPTTGRCQDGNKSEQMKPYGLWKRRI